MENTVIQISETSLRDVIASQLAAKFNDPEIISAFVSTLLETQVDSYGRMTAGKNNPTMLRWAIESVVKRFVEETAKTWLEERHDELIDLIGKELAKSKVVERLAKETAELIVFV